MPAQHSDWELNELATAARAAHEAELDRLVDAARAAHEAERVRPVPTPLHHTRSDQHEPEQPVHLPRRPHLEHGLLVSEEMPAEGDEAAMHDMFAAREALLLANGATDPEDLAEIREIEAEMARRRDLMRAHDEEPYEAQSPRSARAPEYDRVLKEIEPEFRTISLDGEDVTLLDPFSIKEARAKGPAAVELLQRVRDVAELAGGAATDYVQVARMLKPLEHYLGEILDARAELESMPRTKGAQDALRAAASECHGAILGLQAR